MTRNQLLRYLQVEPHDELGGSSPFIIPKQFQIDLNRVPTHKVKGLVSDFYCFLRVFVVANDRLLELLSGLDEVDCWLDGRYFLLSSTN